MRVLTGAVVVLAFAGFSAAQDKKDKKDEKFDAKKLLGKWEPLDMPKGGPGVVVEFADKGKLVLHVDYMGKAEKIEGTYKLDGEKLDMAVSYGGKEEKETVTLTKLTDDELSGKNSKNKEEKYKRLKK